MREEGGTEEEEEVVLRMVMGNEGDRKMGTREGQSREVGREEEKKKVLRTKK